MIKRQEIYYSKFSSKQLYELVGDIEKYPEFLPWCAASRVIETSGDVIKAELVVQFSAFMEKYTSQVTFVDPKNDDGVYEIEVDALDGPFKVLRNYWSFSYDESVDKTKIVFAIEFEFKSFLLQKLIGSMFEAGLHKMMAAFERRAELIYGSTPQ